MMMYIYTQNTYLEIAHLHVRGHGPRVLGEDAHGRDLAGLVQVMLIIIIIIIIIMIVGSSMHYRYGY